MNFKKMFLALFFVFVAMPHAFAAIRVVDSSGVDQGTFHTLILGTGFTVTPNGTGVATLQSNPNIADTITLQNGETITNTVDDTVNVASDDNNTTLQITGYEAKSAILRICGDQCDDNADQWSIEGEPGVNDVLMIRNNASGSNFAMLTLYNTGSLGMLNGEYIKNLVAGTVRIGAAATTEILEVISAGTTDQSAILQLTADNGADNGDSWQIKHDGSGNVLEFLSNVSGSFVQKLGMGTDGTLYLADSEQIINSGDIVYFLGDDNDTGVAVTGFEAKDAYILLQADQSDDNGDDWKIESDQATNSLIISNDTSGSQVAKLTITTAGVMTSGVGAVHTSSTSVAITAGTTPTITVVPGRQVFTDTITTDNQDQTIGVSGVGSAGDEMIIIFITDAAGSADEVITFGTNIRSTGTLTLANVSSSRYVVSFVSDGTKWNERARTAVQAA